MHDASLCFQRSPPTSLDSAKAENNVFWHFFLCHRKQLVVSDLGKKWKNRHSRTIWSFWIWRRIFWERLGYWGEWIDLAPEEPTNFVANHCYLHKDSVNCGYVAIFKSKRVAGWKRREVPPALCHLTCPQAVWKAAAFAALEDAPRLATAERDKLLKSDPTPCVSGSPFRGCKGKLEYQTIYLKTSNSHGENFIQSSGARWHNSHSQKRGTKPWLQVALSPTFVICMIT